MEWLYKKTPVGKRRTGVGKRCFLTKTKVHISVLQRYEKKSNCETIYVIIFMLSKKARIGIHPARAKVVHFLHKLQQRCKGRQFLRHCNAFLQFFFRDNLNGCTESSGNGLHRLQRYGILSGLNAREVLLSYASPLSDLLLRHPPFTAKAGELPAYTHAGEMSLFFVHSINRF